ncbi:MAG: sel1 repeat family protein [Nitrospinaceae bacterium]|nr:sel1 repeat family protein [Nitrospinaceae bacterium]
MKRLILTILILILMSVPVYGNDFNDGLEAYKRKNYKEAVRLWLPVAEQGYSPAQSNLGLMYQNGQGVPQDYKEAIKWFKRSAEQGTDSGQYGLGQMYDFGQGVPQDYKEAVKWYRLAAEQGLSPAQYNLGVMYWQGIGVMQDYVLAHMWFNLSGSNGNKNGVEGREMADKKMSPLQIEKAQEMAREWMEENK